LRAAYQPLVAANACGLRTSCLFPDFSLARYARESSMHQICHFALAGSGDWIRDGENDGGRAFPCHFDSFLKQADFVLIARKSPRLREDMLAPTAHAKNSFAHTVHRNK